MVQVSLEVGSKGSILSVVELTRGCMLQRGKPQKMGDYAGCKGRIEIAWLQAVEPKIHHCRRVTSPTMSTTSLTLSIYSL